MPLSEEGRAILREEGIAPETVTRALSTDAKLIGGTYFGLMRPGHGELTFHMVENRPTERTQAALDELVEAGLVSREPFNRYGGVVYRPLWNFRSLFQWAVTEAEKHKDFALTEPIRN